LPAWVTLVVVNNDEDPQYAGRGAALASEITDMLAGLDLPQVKSIRRLDEFVELMPALVTKMQRQFLRRFPRLDPPGPWLADEASTVYPWEGDR